MKTIAVFGSALPAPEHPIYQLSYDLGKLLGQAGYSVMTGGYNGVMAAVSKGACESGGRVIGATCLSLERLRGSQPNSWLTEVMPRDTLRDRLNLLIDLSDAYVVMPGGLGTLAELVLASELMRAGEIARRPTICYGQFWRPIIEAASETEYNHSSGWENICYADTAADIVELIRAHVPL